jgi:hypothetical protein
MKIKQNKSNKKYVEFHLNLYFPRVKEAKFLIPLKGEDFNKYYMRVYNNKQLLYFLKDLSKYKKLHRWYYVYQNNYLHEITNNHSKY